jgi:prepilin-type N-terminal cleavage/methylation domain-containing protein
MKQTKAFTIVELLIVIVVIGILAAITMVAFTNMQQRARDSRRQQVAADLVKAINAYAIDNNGSDITVGGGAGGGTGWVSGGSPTIPSTLQASGIVPNASGLRDPQCLAGEVAGCSGFIKFRCGSNFAIAGKLEMGGTPSLPSEMSGCANSGWWGQYGMNFYRMGG